MLSTKKKGRQSVVSNRLATLKFVSKMLARVLILGILYITNITDELPNVLIRNTMQRTGPVTEKGMVDDSVFEFEIVLNLIVLDGVILLNIVNSRSNKSMVDISLRLTQVQLQRERRQQLYTIWHGVNGQWITIGCNDIHDISRGNIFVSWPIQIRIMRCYLLIYFDWLEYIFT